MKQTAMVADTPSHECSIQYSVFCDDNLPFTCRSGESVLAAMERHNLKPIKVGCRGGGCGVCRVKVTSGNYLVGSISRAHVSVEEQAEGYELACQVYPQGDLQIAFCGPKKKVSETTSGED